MERLTYKDKDGQVCPDCIIQDCLDKLSNYEDFDEKGQLYILPIGIGDKVYIENPYVKGELVEGKVDSIQFENTVNNKNKIQIVVDFYAGENVDYKYFEADQIGNSIFFDKVEVQEKLGLE